MVQYMQRIQKLIEIDLLHDMQNLCSVWGTQTERVNAQETFVGRGGAVATAYALNPQSGTLLTLHIRKMP